MYNSINMRNLNKAKIDRYIEDHTFIKYFFTENIEHVKSSFLNIVYNNEEFIFSIERLTIRRFSGDDYKKNNNRKIFKNSSFRIGLYLEGESQIYINDKLKSINQSTLFLQSPGNQISLTPKVPSECTVLEFYFDLTNNNKNQIDMNFISYLNRLFGIDISSSHELNLINETTKNELQDIFLTLYERLVEYYVTDNDSRINITIFKLFHKISQILSVREVKEDNLVLNNVIREIKNNYQNDFTVDDLAKLASLSKHYFQNLFKRTYGITPIDYLNKVRIKHAKFMLKNYNYSCSEISNNIGFNSPLYFSKVFKKYTGVSPTNYRSSIKP